MARGFESKNVESQQEERARAKEVGPELSAAEAARVARRRTLELTRARAQADLGGREVSRASRDARGGHQGPRRAATIHLMRSPRVFTIGLLLLASACSMRDAACGRPGPEVAQVPDQPSATAPVDPAVGAQVHIAFLGDSLTAGLGLLAQQAYPQVVVDMLENEGYHVEPVNAGMSGDTTAGGLRRVEPLLNGSTKILVLALGAQRCAARSHDAADARQPGADHRRGAVKGRIRAALRDGGADKSRARLPGLLPQRVHQPAARVSGPDFVRAVPARRRGRQSGAEPG